MKKVGLTVVLVLYMVAASAQEWVVEPIHSSLRFSAVYLGLSKVHGAFDSFQLTMKAEKDDFSDAVISLTVDVKSISTRINKRDDHLKGPDYFDSEQYPQMTFVSSKIELLTPKQYKLYGDLTLHGITLPVELDVTSTGRTINPMNNIETIGFTIKGTLDRMDYEVGKKGIISKEVDISADIQMINK